MKLNPLILPCAFLCVGRLMAQPLTVTEITSPAQLAGLLQGPNVTISGLSIAPVQADTLVPQIGTFNWSGTTEALPDSGIIFSTGSVLHAVGHGTHASTVVWFYPAQLEHGDDDIDLLSPGDSPSFDACMIEFDVVPAEEVLRLAYVFASDEYTGYTCSEWNDHFGIFLSGPGITGPFSNGSVNIALVPNSQAPVSINTVNAGYPSPFTGYPENCFSADPNWQSNTQYFLSSTPAMDMAYDGLTVQLDAMADVIPGETYHIKIVIADVADGQVDSAIFLKAGGVTSTAPITTGVGDDHGINAWSLDDRQLAIHAAGRRLGRLTLYDRSGRIVAASSGNQSDQAIMAVGDLPPGIYVLSAEVDGVYHRMKILK
jgi:hypothetical protein